MKKPERNKDAGESRTVDIAGAPIENEQSHRVKIILHDLGKGLFFTILLLGAKWCVDQSTFGKQLQMVALNLLQMRLSSGQSSEPPPVALLDIGNLRPENFDIDGRKGVVTPRDSLLMLIEACAKQEPVAIAIDIDFSPDNFGYKYPRDPEFFEACMRIHQSTGIPVFLGIARTVTLPRKYWLGGPDYKELAASIVAPAGAVGRMLRWTRTEEDPEGGPTIGTALAEAFQKSSLKPPKWLQWATDAVSIKQAGKELTTEEFLVDFSRLEAIEDARLQTISVNVIADQGRLLRGKMLLFGDGTRGQATDTAIVPGREEPIPGVYLHACASYTLVTSPLYELTMIGRVTLDLTLSIAIFVAIASIRIKYQNRVVSERRLRAFLTAVLAILALIIGVVFVRFTRLIWDDFILVVAVLLLHPAVERCLTKFCRYLETKIPQIIFKPDEADDKENGN